MKGYITNIEEKTPKNSVPFIRRKRRQTRQSTTTNFEKLLSKREKKLTKAD